VSEVWHQREINFSERGSFSDASYVEKIIDFSWNQERSLSFCHYMMLLFTGCFLLESPSL